MVNFNADIYFEQFYVSIESLLGYSAIDDLIHIAMQGLTDVYLMHHM